MEAGRGEVLTVGHSTSERRILWGSWGLSVVLLLCLPLALWIKTGFFVVFVFVALAVSKAQMISSATPRLRAVRLTDATHGCYFDFQEESSGAFYWLVSSWVLADHLVLLSVERESSSDAAPVRRQRKVSVILWRDAMSPRAWHRFRVWHRRAVTFKSLESAPR